MEADLSKQFLQKYHSLNDHTIEVHTSDDKILTGILAGYIREDASDHTSLITCLHLIPEGICSITGEDPYGLPKGVFVKQKEIVQIKFSDQSIMKF